MKTTVVNKNTTLYDVYVGRSTAKFHFGNPFSFLLTSLATVKVKTRDESVQAFSEWLEGTAWQNIEEERRRWILDNVHTLKGKRLGCFCKPEACHGDILARLADESL